MNEWIMGLISMLFLLIGLLAGAIRWRGKGSGLADGQRDKLEYTRKLMDNYHAAHQTSPLSGMEIEEILRLAKDKIDEVLR